MITLHQLRSALRLSGYPCRFTADLDALLVRFKADEYPTPADAAAVVQAAVGADYVATVRRFDARTVEISVAGA